MDKNINQLMSHLEMEEAFGNKDLLVEKQAQGPVLSRSSVERVNPVDLDALRAEVAACQKCQLCQTRTQTVFCDGSPQAKLMFIGEAPGRDEDLQGKPFVGRAGQLLTKMIEAMGFKREEIYIANILKCRPPENRNPAPFEIEQCYPYLQQQIAAIQPKVICALGKFAAQSLLKTETPISRLRGQVFELEGRQCVPTYHPAYLLRNPSAKKDCWADLQKVMQLLK